MLTLKLWSALHHPPSRHPLFRRTYLARRTPLMRNMRLWIILAIFSLLCMLSLVPALAFSSLGLVLASAPLLLLVFHSTFYGALWAAGIGATINGEQERGTYDLLCTAPAGAMGVCWVICVACLHRYNTLASVHNTLRSILSLLAGFFTLGALLIAFAIGVNTLFGDPSMSGGAATDAFVGAVIGLMLVMTFYVDHLQTVVLSSIIGMSTPGFAASRFEGRMWAVGAFFLAQLVVYGAFVVVGFIVLPPLMHSLGVESLWWALLLGWALRLSLLCLLREGLIIWLWDELARRLNTHTIERDLIAT